MQRQSKKHDVAFKQEAASSFVSLRALKGSVACLVWFGWQNVKIMS